MQNLTPAGQNIVNDISARYGLSFDAVVHMLVAVNNGGGSMAQFNSPELGGSGQWMRGGMIMVGDMFNNGLKNTVDNLCNELANALANQQMFPPANNSQSGFGFTNSSSNQWWPSELGAPFSSGSQNNSRYAIFPNRLAVEVNGQVQVYDTLDHNIGGVSQQQGMGNSLSFSSQYGQFSVDSLPLVNGQTNNPTPQPTLLSTNQSTNQATYQQTQQPPAQPEPAINPATSPSMNSNEVFGLLEQLGKLRDAGVLTDQEFDSKKQELLARI